jgi:hypothetical protein
MKHNLKHFIKTIIDNKLVRSKAGLTKALVLMMEDLEKSLPPYEFRKLSKLSTPEKSRSETNVMPVLPSGNKPNTEVKVAAHKILNSNIIAGAPEYVHEKNKQYLIQHANELTTDRGTAGFTASIQGKQGGESSVAIVHAGAGEIVSQHEAGHLALHKIKSHYGQASRDAVVNKITSFFHPDDVAAIKKRWGGAPHPDEEAILTAHTLIGREGSRTALKDSAGTQATAGLLGMKRVRRSVQAAAKWTHSLDDEGLKQLTYDHINKKAIGMKKSEEVDTNPDISALASEAGIDLEKVEFDKQDLTNGYKIELEHTDDPETKVISDPVDVIKVAWRHLKEDKDYYKKLKEMEAKKSLTKAAIHKLIATHPELAPTPEEFKKAMGIKKAYDPATDELSISNIRSEISPEGEINKVDKNRWHNIGDYHYAHGWLSGGHGWGVNVQGDRKTLENPNHPAVQQMANQIKKLHPSIDKIEAISIDYAGETTNAGGQQIWSVPRHLAEKGIFKKPSKVQEFHSKSEEDGDLNKSDDSPVIYVATDGDNIGASVERAAMANDMDTIIAQSAKIKAGNEVIRSWALSRDGKIYIDGGDDVSFVIDQKYADGLDKLRLLYQETTGHTVTIGIGNNIPSAGHAMLYGKLNGKNKCVTWTRDIEEELDRIAHDLTPEEKIKEHGLLRASQLEDFSLRKALGGGEMWSRDKFERDNIRPIHGWASNDGTWNQMQDHDSHNDEAEDSGFGEGGDTDAWQDALKQGHLPGGRGGTPTITINPEHHLNSRHPAVMTMAKQIKKLPAGIDEINVNTVGSYDVYKIPRRLAEKGVFKQPSGVQSFYRGESTEPTEPSLAQNSLYKAEDEEDAIELEHWSGNPLISTINPDNHGKGIRGQESERKAAFPDEWVNRSYFYSKGAKREHGLGPFKYNIKVPKHHMYDLSKDPDHYFEKTNPEHPYLQRLNHTEKLVRNAGYRGAYLGRQGGVTEEGKGHVYLMFHPERVNKSELYGDTEQLDKSEEDISKIDSLHKLAGDTVDGRSVGKRIDNLSSIEGSIYNPIHLKGIREIQMSHFEDQSQPSFYSSTEEKRTHELANQIKESGRVDPLIIVHDRKGPYVLEGGHRFDALKILGAKSFPAKVVIDGDEIGEKNIKKSDQSSFGHDKPEVDVDSLMDGRHGHFSILSAERHEKTDEENKNRTAQLKSELESLGHYHIPIKGNWQYPDKKDYDENSFIVFGPHQKEIERLGQKYEKESVIHSTGSSHEMHYITGEHAGKHKQGIGHELLSDPDIKYHDYSELGGKKFRMNFNDTLHDREKSHLSKYEDANDLFKAKLYPDRDV